MQKSVTLQLQITIVISNDLIWDEYKIFGKETFIKNKKRVVAIRKKDLVIYFLCLISTQSFFVREKFKGKAIFLLSLFF